MENTNKQESSIIEETNKETTFNKLKNIQILLKKESALKGLFTETGRNTKKDIESLSTDIFKNKIEVLNILKNDQYTNNILNFHLVQDNKDYLKTLYLYIPKFLSYLWEHPSIIAKLMLNSNTSDNKLYLAPLICNDFYENILSPNYIEDQLIFIIYLLLDEEIKKINSVHDYKKFLNNTICGYLLDELVEKKDVKAFFKIIFKDIIEILELSSGDNEILFDPFRIEQNLIERKNSLKKSVKRQSSKGITIVDSQRQRTEEETKNHELFFTNYLIDLSLTKLKEMKNEYTSKNNKVMENYIDLQIKGQTSEEIYSNKEYFKMMNNNSLFTYEILITYERSFIKVIKFIDSLMNTISENLDLLPYSIRCICKIISSLLEKKFENITLIEKNMFLSQFFLNKLFLPMLVNPASGAFINNYIISNTTLHNLHSISHLISQFLSFRLFNSNEKGMYSPFNYYFIENMNKLVDIYDHIIKVKFPSFIEKLLNGEISKDSFEYDYFKENKNEILFNRTMFLSVNHIKILLKNITHIRDSVFNKDNNEFQIIISKLMNVDDNVKFLESLCAENDYKIKRIVKKGNRKEEKKEQHINYMLFSDLLFNEKHKKLFTLDRDDHSHFKLEEKKIKKSTDTGENKDNKEIIENTIIKTKNVISTILYNYRGLTETDFQEGQINSTLAIFKKLRVFMKSTDFVLDDRIPSDWYIELLFEYLKKLPPEYKENDYDKLYKELKIDIEKSIKEYNFEELSIIIDKRKFGKKIKAYYTSIKDILQEINLNINVNRIIETEQINVKLYFRYNDEKKELNIYQEDMGDKQLDFLDSFIFADTNQKARLCKTILAFTKYFPNLNNYIVSKSDSKNIFDIQKELNVPSHLNTFFNIIKNHLKSYYKKGNEKELNITYDKVYDYVMSKIYHKIYPQEIDVMDLSLYKKIQIYSWIEPNNLMEKNYNYNFELVLPDITKFFNLINIEKSPRKKLLNLNNIFESINILLKFSQNSKAIGVDNQLPLFNYIFLKAKPKEMYTNYQFMVLYSGEKIKKNEGGYLAQLKSVIEFTFELAPNKLYNITQKEFEDNCKSSVNEEVKE